jgi:hypothetical protein
MLTSLSEMLDRRRREIAATPSLGALASRLGHLLGPLLARPLYVPAEKATLTRDGGVCPMDGARLEFDPLSPQEHRCGRCGAAYTGERHHGAWLWRYHLWLAERAIHLALLGGLRNDAEHRDRARELLLGCAAAYPRVPNRDNVLGPSRLFFSTYLESIWLAQVAFAGALVEAGDPVGSVASRELAPLRAAVRESAAIVGSFDEGWSNRQVWNDVGLLAAGLWLDEEPLVTGALDGPHGLVRQLAHGVTADGLWYEGENYHFFALRGFVLGAELLRVAGRDLYQDPAAGEKLKAMFVAPLDTVLPDLTLPARGDAVFGVSLRQPRFAELWEIARARAPHPRVEAILADLYAAGGPEAPDDDGLSELAEQERNRPPRRVRRDQLGWKALLAMLPDAPAPARGAWVRGSCLLGDAGVAVLRSGERYVSLECGGRPGGHGHPDLLHVSLHVGDGQGRESGIGNRASSSDARHDSRIPISDSRPSSGNLLADPGTGSYVSPSLHWYRSTLAHNAPGLAEHGQLARRAYAAAFAVRGDWSWCHAVAPGLLGPLTEAGRTVILGPRYLLDVVDVEMVGDGVVELPLHPLGGSPGADQPAGEDRLLDVELDRLPLDAAGGLNAVFAPRPGEVARIQWAPGPPGFDFSDGPSRPFLVRAASGSGRWVAAYETQPDAVWAVRDGGGEIVVETPRGADRFRMGSRMRPSVEIVEGDASPVVLEGVRAEPPAPAPPPRARPLVVSCRRLDAAPDPRRWQTTIPAIGVHRLGMPHYRRSELSWREAGGTSADVAIFATRTAVGFAVSVRKPSLVLRPPEAADPALDNEAPDIHSDGIQCYVGSGAWEGYVVVPIAGSDRIAVRAVAGTAGDPDRVSGSWAPTADGWNAVITVNLGCLIEPDQRVPVNLVINEMLPGRVRRAGQLVLSGAAGWVYLRGDREAPGDAARAVVE